MISDQHNFDARTTNATLTHIDNANVHAKGITRKIGDKAHVIAQITKRSDPMRDGGPDRHPCQELGVKIGDMLLLSDVVDGVVEQRDQTSDTDNSERLARKDTEYDGSQGRREQCLVNPEEAACLPLHVKQERQSR